VAQYFDSWCLGYRLSACCKCCIDDIISPIQFVLYKLCIPQSSKMLNDRAQSRQYPYKCTGEKFQILARLMDNTTSYDFFYNDFILTFIWLHCPLADDIKSTLLLLKVIIAALGCRHPTYLDYYDVLWVDSDIGVCIAYNDHIATSTGASRGTQLLYIHVA
jgi:hypothetical protein